MGTRGESRARSLLDRPPIPTHTTPHTQLFTNTRTSITQEGRAAPLVFRGPRARMMRVGGDAATGGGVGSDGGDDRTVERARCAK